MTPDKIEILSQKFIMEALNELGEDWKPLRELSFDWNTFETLVWLDMADRQLEQLIGPGDAPCGTRFYYKRRKQE